jgi:hypothetical protein
MFSWWHGKVGFCWRKSRGIPATKSVPSPSNTDLVRTWSQLSSNSSATIPIGVYRETRIRGFLECLMLDPGFWRSAHKKGKASICSPSLFRITGLKTILHQPSLLLFHRPLFLFSSILYHLLRSTPLLYLILSQDLFRMLPCSCHFLYLLLLHYIH